MAKDLQALLAEHGFLPGVAGHASAGNLHFMLTPDFSKPEDTRALRRVHGGADRAGDRRLRRLAQGRARDRGEHGAVRRARMGPEGGGADAAGQAARRSRRRARARGCDQRRPRGPPAQPQDDTVDRGVGRHLRRVRLLRARLPQPPPDHHPAPADRAPPRDGAPGARLPGARGPAGGVRIRRARDLRRRRHLPARLSGRDRHREVRQGAALASSTPSAPSRSPCGSPDAGTRPSAPRGRACAPAAVAALRARRSAAPAARPGRP